MCDTFLSETHFLIVTYFFKSDTFFVSPIFPTAKHFLCDPLFSYGNFLSVPISLTVSYFIQVWLIFQQWQMLLAVTHFFQLWPIFIKCDTRFWLDQFYFNCDLFFQVWPIFLTAKHFLIVTHFSTVRHFLSVTDFFQLTHFLNCNLFSKLWNIFF